MNIHIPFYNLTQKYENIKNLVISRNINLISVKCTINLEFYLFSDYDLEEENIIKG
jgi:hypothetical protein